MAIPNLPVWTIRPNWAGGILERLEWLTDILPSTSGVEQRRAARPTPRRFVEITVHPTNAERTFLDLILHSMGGETWLFPLWFDKGRLSATAASGQKRIAFDNTFREFTVGGLALLYRDTFTYEVVEISAQDDTGINVVSNLGSAWGKGAAIYPLRRAISGADTSLGALTSRVGESVLLFQINEANPYPEIAPNALLHLGTPVMTIAPNRKATITTDHTRMIDKRDGTTGLVELTDNTGRSFSAQAHNWMIVGREAQSAFRSMLYWMRGRQRAVWLPTYNDDVTLSRPAVVGAVNLDINKIGMGYVGGVKPGREKIRFGSQIVSLTQMGGAQSAQEERLRISAGLATALPKGRSGSFMDIARLDSDTLELHHHADTNGVMECGSTFRAFKDTRTTAGAIYLPIPAAEMSEVPCGQPEFNNPCSPLPSPWKLKLSYIWTAPNDLSGYKPVYGFPSPQDWVGPNGGIVEKGKDLPLDGFGGSLDGPKAIPGTDIILDVYYPDNQYPNGDPGDPIMGWRRIMAGGYCYGLEYYFCAPVSSAPEDRIVHWQVQFGTDTFMGVPSEERGGTITAELPDGTILTTFVRNPTQLFPFDLDFSY